MFSQSEKQDLYIAYKDCTIHCIVKTENDTLIYENYQIRFGDKVKKESEFSVSASWDLIEKISISGKTYPSLALIYTNQKNENSPLKINESQIKNKIWAQDIIYSKNTDFRAFFKNFKNIYLVDYNNPKADYRIAKKIEVIFLHSLWIKTTANRGLLQWLLPDFPAENPLLNGMFCYICNGLVLVQRHWEQAS